MNPYVKALIASRKCEGDERSVVSVGDSGQTGTDVYWAEPIRKWVCVDLNSVPQIVTSEEIVLVRLHEDADPEDGLSQRALASDCERDAGLWLVDGDDLEQLTSRYGAALEVLWSSKTNAVAAVRGGGARKR